MSLETRSSEVFANSKNLFCREPYVNSGCGPAEIADSLSHGEFGTFRLTIPGASMDDFGDRLGVIEAFACKHRLGGATWEGLGSSLNAKLSARRRIDYYRLNLMERIEFVDADASLGDDSGASIDWQIQAAFPELEISEGSAGLVITLHLRSPQ